MKTETTQQTASIQQQSAVIFTRRNYMRDYHKKRYHSDVIQARNYQQSIKLKKKLNISEEHWEKYKHNLADIIKLLQISQHLSSELILEVLQNPPQINLQ